MTQAASQSSSTIRTVNPATEETLQEYKIMTKPEVKLAVDKAQDTFRHKWGKMEYKDRADFLHNFAAELRKDKEKLAKVATNEMGKTVKEARSEVEKCAWAADYFADNGAIFTSDEVVNTDARKSIVTFQPLGVIGSIMPWNFPYWQALRFAAPSLMAGNTIVLKPASATMQCGIEIEQAFARSGLPEGVFQTLVGNSSTAEALIDSEINGVTFTGSVPVGAKVAQKATSQLKKCVLELGGSDPFIVCEDADVDKASDGAVKGRFINCGQSCIASKRFFVSKGIANEFIEKFVQKTKKLRVGDPLSDDSDMGPLVNAKARDSIESLVNETAKDGAELLTGGERVGGKGFFYRPTIFGKVSPRMRIAQEESFGPVAPVTVVDDDKDALVHANDSQFGLGASIWTQDLDKADRLSREIETGIVTVNNVVASDPRVPFGGVKKSGIGRELSRYGMLEFVNIKSIRYYDRLIVDHHVE
ncbi:MAG TPA: NAD-dependent succinate-semialdehyde dehydrogenase [Nitrososphaera sp.]|nr:NAD-dependent succinate-semialdehyde dehydrogenase [Nitrososphaera sp.]